MNDSFDKAYARYLGSLAKLDATNDITEKNLLFRELAEQLLQLEDTLKTHQFATDTDDLMKEAAAFTACL